MNVKVYVEGGGEGRELKDEVPPGVQYFLPQGQFGRTDAENHRLRSQGQDLPTTSAPRWPTRRITTSSSCLSTAKALSPMGAGPWLHLKNRDNWDKPAGAADDNAHLMVQCMEAWFLADKDALAKYFGGGFNWNALPGRPDVENISKSDLQNGLKNATKQCKPKGKYHKGRHSFAILTELDPKKVIAASPHAARLVAVLKANA